MSKTGKEQIRFFIKESNNYEYWRSCLINWFIEPQIMEMGKMAVEVLEPYDLEILDADEKAVGKDFVKKAKEGGKTDVVALLAVLLCEDENAETFVGILPGRIQSLWKRLLKTYYVAQSDAEQLAASEILSNSMFNRHTLGDCSWSIVKTLSAYKNSGKDWNSIRYFYFYPALYARIYKAFYPEVNSSLTTSKTLPEDEDLRQTDFEQDIFIDVNVVQSLYLQGTYTTRPSKLIPAQVKKGLQSLSLKEFELSPLMEDVTYMRAEFLVAGMAMMSLCYPQMLKAGNVKPQDILKSMVDKVQYHKELTFEMFLPAISGIKKKDLDSCVSTRIFSRIQQILKNVGEGWIKMEDFDGQLIKLIADYRNPLLLITAPDVSDYHYIFNKYTMTAVTPDRQMQQMGFAFVHSFIAYLASLGCATIAYRDVDRKDASPYDCIRYFKLNALGRYVLGFSEEYTPPSVHLDKEYFELDEHRLIVRSIEEDNPYLHVVQDIANPLYGGRYEVTSSSFLAHCNSEKDVDYKITVFRQYVNSNLPEIWQNFFSRIKQHCNPLKACMPQLFKIYQLEPDNKELIQLLITDVKLRNYILRSEDYYIMVKASRLQDFEERMRELGYLL